MRCVPLCFWQAFSRVSAFDLLLEASFHVEQRWTDPRLFRVAFEEYYLYTLCNHWLGLSIFMNKPGWSFRGCGMGEMNVLGSHTLPFCPPYCRLFFRWSVWYWARFLCTRYRCSEKKVTLVIFSNLHTFCLLGKLRVKTKNFENRVEVLFCSENLCNLFVFKRPELRPIAKLSTFISLLLFYLVLVDSVRVGSKWNWRGLFCSPIFWNEADEWKPALTTKASNLFHLVLDD